MEETNTDNQELKLKNKIDVFFTKAIKNRSQRGFCITKDKMAVMLDKWSLFIMYNLGYFQRLRFNELKGNIKGISSKMLSTTLKKLESNDVIKRTAYAEVPPRVVYELTPFGLKLTDRTVDLNDWLLETWKQKEEDNG